MTAITFDTLKLARKLKDAGFDDKQAEALAEAMDTGIEDLATKHDVAMLEVNLVRKIENLEERTQGRFTLLQWMLGFNIAATLAVLWMLFKLATA